MDYLFYPYSLITQRGELRQQGNVEIVDSNELSPINVTILPRCSLLLPHRYVPVY